MPMITVVPKDNLMIHLVIVINLLSLCQCYRNGDRRIAAQKTDSIIEKYMLAVKKLSDDFPNHQIELHLDIAGEDPQKARRRVNYIHLRDPTAGSIRTNEQNKPEGISMPKSISVSSTDSEMRPVFMKDLKTAIEELERKYNGQIHTTITPSYPHVDDNLKPILQLLEKGTLVNHDLQKPPEENMSWLQIKIPK